MRIGLIAAIEPSLDGTGLRAGLSMAGRSVLEWQAALLDSLAAERVLCLCRAAPGSEVLAVQHAVEARGASFHALQGFAALPALVRAEDDLIILRDGLWADPALVQALLRAGAGPVRGIVTLPAEHPLAAAHPAVFERIDRARRWGGVLAMRGAPVQRLAEFPGDADPVALLLRLALQTGTATCDLAALSPAPEAWVLADCPAALAAAEQALIARVVPPTDWRAPLAALAALMLRRAAPRVAGQDSAALGAAALAFALLIGTVILAAFGLAAAGLALAALGGLAGQFARALVGLTARLHRAAPLPRMAGGLAVTGDTLAALGLWLALAPLPQWQPLAALGPLTIGLARLVAQATAGALAVIAADRASLLAALALAAAAGLLAEVTACLAVGLLAALLLRPARD